jgi:hypothetical protein
MDDILKNNAFTIIVFIFICYYWIIKKLKVQSKIVKMAPWFVLIVSFIIWFGINWYPDLRFDREGWLNNKDKRFEYSEYILNSKMLIGKTKSDVILLLDYPLDSVEKDIWEYGLKLNSDEYPGYPYMIVIEFTDGKSNKVYYSKYDSYD